MAGMTSAASSLTMVVLQMIATVFVTSSRTTRVKKAPKRIALVGNSQIDASLGALIDSHDIVVRFNKCTNYGVSGHRTDVLVLVNTGSAGKRIASGDVNHEAFGAARSVWLARPRIVNAIEKWRYSVYAKRKPWYSSSRGDWDDYTARIVEHIGSRPHRCLGLRTYWLAMRMTMAHGGSALQTPSTGFLTLTHIRQHLRPCEVTLFGFTHQGWNGHPWEAERAQIAEWHDWVRYCTASD